MSLDHGQCYNCFSNELLTTYENVTCLSCSRIQFDTFEDAFDSTPVEKKISQSFLQEYCERYFLTELEKSKIVDKLNHLKHHKSAFSKNELILSLIYATLCENGYTLSPRSFSGEVGSLISPKQLSSCVSYLKTVFEFEKIDSNVSWDTLLKPFARGLYS